MVDVSNAFLFLFLRETGEDRFIFDPRRNSRVRVSISRSRRRAPGLAAIVSPRDVIGRIELSRTNRFFRMINRPSFGGIFLLLIELKLNLRNQDWKIFICFSLIIQQGYRVYFP